MRTSSLADLLQLALPGFLAVLLGAIAASAVLYILWVRANRQQPTHSSLGGLGHQVLQAGLEPKAVYAAIKAHVRRFAPDVSLVVQLRSDAEHQAPLTILPGGVVVEGEQQAEVTLDAYDWLMSHRSLLAIPDLSRSPVRPLSTRVPAGSALHAPLIVGDRFLGAISLQSPRRRGLGSGQATALAACAEQIALGIEGARLHRQERERSAQLLLIAQVSRKVAAILDLDALFADTVRLVQQTLGFYHVSIFSVDREAGIVALQASSSPLIQQRGIVLPVGVGLIGNAALGEAVVARDVSQDDRFVPDAALDQTAAEVALPLMVEDRVLGVLDLQSDVRGSLTPDAISTLRILADQIAVAIEDSHIYRAQQEQAWVSTALLQVAEALARESTQEGIAAAVSRLTEILIGVERSAILSYSAETDTVTVSTPHGAGNGDSDSPCYRAEHIPLLSALMPGPVTILEPEAMGPLVGLWGAAHLAEQRLLACPLALRGELFGVLVAPSASSDGLPPPQRAVLEGIAQQAALALDNARLVAAQREEAWVSTALLQVANVAANASYDLRETTATMVRLAPMLMGISWCAVLLQNPAQDSYAGVASYGASPELGENGAAPVFLTEDQAWLLETQRAEQVSLLPSSVVYSALGIRPTQGTGAEILALPMRAHQRDLGLLLVGLPADSPTLSGRRMALLTGIAGQMSLAISATRLYEQSLLQERMEHEMRLARDIQTSFLPESYPRLPGWRIAVDWRAARGVAGDYYDLQQLSPTQWGISIADVSDKGVAAALYMALSRTVLRAAAITASGPAETLQRANRVLMDDSRSGMFVSLVYGILDVSRGSFNMVRAGHNPPLLLRASDRQISVLEPGGIVLGVVAEPELEELTVELQPGDALVLYTDGVTEAWNGDGQEFGLDRLQAVLREVLELAPETIIEHVYHAVIEFVGNLPQADDYTLMVVQREPAD